MPTANVGSMTRTSVPALDVYLPGHEVLAPGLPQERCVLAAGAGDNLPRGTITNGADDCLAVTDGWGGFQDVELEGAYSPEDSAVLPAYIITGPDLPVLIPGPGAVFSSQAEVARSASGFTPWTPAATCSAGNGSTTGRPSDR